MRYSFVRAKHGLACSAGLAVLFLAGLSARASVPLYEFGPSDSPNSLDGFAANGGGVTLTHTTNPLSENAINAVTIAGFKGILTTQAQGLTILDNPNITSISADITVPAGFTYPGGYADLGVTIFCSDASESEFGVQYQVAPADEQNIDLTPGTTTTITIPLTGNDPDTGNPETYGQLLTTGGSNSAGFVPGGFEFFFDENGANNIDIANVQANGISVPEPATIGIGAVGGLMLLARRRRAAR